MKNKKHNKFFTPFQTRSCSEKPTYIFVDFLMNRAGPSNCEGDVDRRTVLSRGQLGKGRVGN
jgi:hypothetical protein